MRRSLNRLWCRKWGYVKVFCKKLQGKHV